MPDSACNLLKHELGEKRQKQKQNSLAWGENSADLHACIPGGGEVWQVLLGCL